MAKRWEDRRQGFAIICPSCGEIITEKPVPDELQQELELEKLRELHPEVSDPDTEC